MLTFTAFLPGSLAAVPDRLVPIILTLFNYRQTWGHYGFDCGEQALCFKLSLFRSSGHFTSLEMDRLLEEALKAMDSGVEALAPFKRNDIEDDEESPLKNAPDLTERVEPPTPSVKALSRSSLYKT